MAQVSKLGIYCTTLCAVKRVNTFKLHRLMSSSVTEKYCKLLVIGGGSGGCSVAAKFASKLGKNNVVIVEPNDTHYYQPLFTLVGGGMKNIKDCSRRMEQVLPKDAEWVKDCVVSIEGQNNCVVTKTGAKINYEFLVVAPGLVTDFHKVTGLVEALATRHSGVCSNYSPHYVHKTFEELENYKEGDLIFTFPNTPVKCPGAPQKIAYITEEYLRKSGKRYNSRVVYNTALGVLFGVKKYADALWEVCKSRGIEVNLRTNLVSVDHNRKVAYFENLDNPEAPKIAMNYSFLHVTPPMSSPSFLRLTPMLVDQAGWLDVDKFTLRHKFYSNIFGIGDCINVPTSKTAAAVAAQSGVLYDNLCLAMKEQPARSFYDGYTSCPLVTGYDKVILAEFDYTLQPLETFPLDQGQESKLMFYLKKDLMPYLYWNAMLTGYWRGPELVRKLLHLKFLKKPLAAST